MDDTVSVSSISELSAELSEVENLNDLKEKVHQGILTQYFSTLPGKFINLGLRAVLSAVLLVVGIKLINLIRRLVKRSLEGFQMEAYVIHFIDGVVRILLYLVLVLILASSLGFDAASVVAIVGSMGLTLGLALQGSLSNFAGGLLLLILKPFKVGDYIIEDTHGNEGTVEAITIFYTKLHTIDNRLVMIPNGMLANTSLVNVTGHPKRQVDMSIGISYSADLKKAKEIMLSVMEKDEACTEQAKPEVFVRALGDSAVVLGGRMWVETSEYMKTTFRLNEKVKLAFDEAGIGIPFPQLDVHLDT